MQEDSTRVLGVSWNPDSDSFFFSNKFPKLKNDMKNNTEPTKRQILKVVMSLFDPLGLLAPLIIRAKILMQNIWKEGTQHRIARILRCKHSSLRCSSLPTTGGRYRN